MLIPAGPVDCPCPPRELVLEPIVRRRVEQLIAGQDRRELALEPQEITRVAPLGIRTEADQQLSSIVEYLLGGEVSERVPGPDRVLVYRLPPGMDHQLDPA